MGRDREKGAENTLYEILTEIFPNLKKETYIQLQEEQRVSNKMNPNRQTPRYNISKTAKQRENSKDSKQKKNSHRQGIPQKPIGRFFCRNFVGKKGASWHIQSAGREKPAT